MKARSHKEQRDDLLVHLERVLALFKVDDEDAHLYQREAMVIDGARNYCESVRRQGDVAEE